MELARSKFFEGCRDDFPITAGSPLDCVHPMAAFLDQWSLSFVAGCFVATGWLLCNYSLVGSLAVSQFIFLAVGECDWMAPPIPISFMKIRRRFIDGKRTNAGLNEPKPKSTKVMSRTPTCS